MLRVPVLHILQTDVVAELLIIPRMSCGPTICEFVEQLRYTTHVRVGTTTYSQPQNGLIVETVAPPA